MSDSSGSISLRDAIRIARRLAEAHKRAERALVGDIEENANDRVDGLAEEESGGEVEPPIIPGLDPERV